MKNAIVILAVLACLLTQAGADDAASVSSRLGEWKSELELDPRVVTEVEMFERKDDPLPDGYAEALANDVRRAIFRTAQQAAQAIADGTAQPFVDVSYPDPGFERHNRPAPDDKVVEEFEDGFLRIEGIAFYKADGKTPAEVMEEYTSRDFRMATSSRIAELWSDDDLSCIETTGVKALLDPTKACNRIDLLVEDDLASEHSQVVSNLGDDDYQRVFFKESLKTFIRTPDGLAVHYINYTRSVKLGTIKRKLGTGKVRGSQERNFEELRRRLGEADAEE